MSAACDLDRFRDARVLITGGLGFIGSNLAHRLVSLGAKVTVLDPLLAQNGGNPRNLDGIADKVEVIMGDIRQSDVIKRQVDGRDFIFNLAGQVSYTDSMSQPFLDHDISCLGHLTLLEACRRVSPQVRIVFSSSRLVYGAQEAMPVPEDAQLRPLTLYGIHKLTAEHYHRLYAAVHDVPTASVRITNPYGPRQRIQGGKYGIVNWFLTLALRGEPIRVFGDGRQLRDYIYIDDLVTSMLSIATLPSLNGQVFNVGSGIGTPFGEMVDAVLHAAGRGTVEHVEWPADYSRFETGDFVADIRRLRTALSWQPQIPLADGLARTVEFLRAENDKRPVGR